MCVSTATIFADPPIGERFTPARNSVSEWILSLKTRGLNDRRRPSSLGEELFSIPFTSVHLIGVLLQDRTYAGPGANTGASVLLPEDSTLLFPAICSDMQQKPLICPGDAFWPEAKVSLAMLEGESGTRGVNWDCMVSLAFVLSM